MDIGHVYLKCSYSIGRVGSWPLMAEAQNICIPKSESSTQIATSIPVFFNDQYLFRQEKIYCWLNHF